MTEKIKDKSNHLRGTLATDIKNQVTGSLIEDNQQLIKFHGVYQQDDRDRRKVRAEKKLERDYSFMIRLRIAGGAITANQWLGITKIADDNSTGVIKITTRQTVQLHGVIKSKLKPTIQYFDQYNLDSIAACGDVNRNVMCTAIIPQDPMQTQLQKYAVEISENFLPKTNAYKEIWLDGEPIDPKTEVEPVYGKTYLPRKFKIVLALPPYNDVDVYAHDIGLIAIKENNQIIGFNILVGGGMGMTHGNEKTYPRTGSLIGFIKEDKVLDVIEKIILIQRDHGNREDRKQARLKYTIDRLGLDWFQQELNTRLTYDLEAAKPFEFTKRGDIFGWHQDKNNHYYYTLFIENGRVLDNAKAAMNQIASDKLGDFTFTNNQNVIITNIKDKEKVSEILNQYQLIQDHSLIRLNSMACVALNTCPLALAEAQRYMPSLISKIEPIITKYSLEKEEISIRMTGCPNGCARPYLGEIAFVGKSLGIYNMYIGADHLGQNLNKLYKESCDEKTILQEIDHLLQNFAINRNDQESFGNFIIRSNIV